MPCLPDAATSTAAHTEYTWLGISCALLYSLPASAAAVTAVVARPTTLGSILVFIR